MIGSYLRGNTNLAANINQNAAGRGTFRLPSSPLLTIGSGGPADYELSIDVNSIKNFDVGLIEKVSHSRVSAFPDFIMDWVNRQLEEVANKLTSLSTLYLIMPDVSGVFDSGWDGFPDKLETAYNQ